MSAEERERECDILACVYFILDSKCCTFSC